MPRCVAKSPTMGIEPPMRINTVSRPRMSAKALAAVGFDGNGRAGAEHADLGLDSGGRVILHEFFECREDFFRILIRHHAHADFSDGFGGDDGFGSRSGVASGDAVNFKSGPSPEALEDGEAGLTSQARGADFGLEELSFGERKDGPAMLLLG